MVCMPKEMGQLHRARGGEGRGGEASRPVAEVPEGPVGLLLPGGLHRHVVLVAHLRAEGPEGGTWMGMAMWRKWRKWRKWRSGESAGLE